MADGAEEEVATIIGEPSGVNFVCGSAAMVNVEGVCEHFLTITKPSRMCGLSFGASLFETQCSLECKSQTQR